MSTRHYYRVESGTMRALVWAGGYKQAIKKARMFRLARARCSHKSAASPRDRRWQALLGSMELYQHREEDMSSQPDARIEAVQPSTRRNLCISCGGPRRSDAKPGRYCSPKCRILASDVRRGIHRSRPPLLVIAEQPPTPESRRNEGKAKAASNHAPDLELARRLALEMLAARGVGTISDLREYAAERGYDLPWHLNWSGAVFLGGAAAAHVKVWFEPTGQRRNSTHLRGNARKVNEYRLTAEGWGAWTRVEELR